jgi:hypothetical protein
LIESHIRELSASRAVNVKLQSPQEVLDDEVSVAAQLSPIEVSTVIENHPDHRRIACCMVWPLSR